MSKSRFADAIGKNGPMINFVIREEDTLGYPPADGEVLSFMTKQLSRKDRNKIANSPTSKKLYSKRALEGDGNLKPIMRKPLPEENQQTAAKLPSAKEAERRKESKHLRISRTEE